MTGRRVAVAELREAHPALRVNHGGTATLRPVRYEDGDYLFKRYVDEYRHRVDAPALERLIDWGLDMDRSMNDDRHHLRGYAAWPRHTVWENGVLLGLLTPVAHPVFRVWDPVRRVEVPRSLEELRASGDTVRNGGQGDPAIKKSAFGNLIETVLWFHDRGVVINDLQQQNTLVTRFGSAVHLVDCDSMTGAHWDPVLKVVAPPIVHAQVPEFRNPTRATDLARLAWVIMATMLEEEVVEVGADGRAELADLLSAPFAEFLFRVRKVSGHAEGDGVVWRQMAADWRRSVRADAGVGGWGGGGGSGGVRDAPRPTPMSTRRSTVRIRQPVDHLEFEALADEVMDDCFRDEMGGDPRIDDPPADLVIGDVPPGAGGRPDQWTAATLTLPLTRGTVVRALLVVLGALLVLLAVKALLPDGAVDG